MSSEVAEREIVELGDENDLEMIEDKNIGKKQAEGKKELVKSDSGEQTKQKLCKCNKCDLSSIMLLFYNVNCQHILCVKCLQLLGHVSQLKCDTVMKNDAKCDALWTRKSTHILTYVDPLFMNVLSVKLESNASLNVDKSDTNVEVCLDTAALKFLRCIKPCIPGLPTLDTSAVLTAKTDNPTTAEPGQNEIMAIDSPPRKRPKRSDSAQKSDESSAAPRKSSTTRSKPAEPKVTSERKSPENKPKANPEHKSPDKKPNPAVEVSKADEKPDLATVVENPLLKRPLSSVENKEKSGEGKIKLNAANDPATYKKVMKKNFKGETQLHSACQKGLLEKAREWLEMGSDPNTSDNANLRPIHEHGVIHNPDLCKLLLEYGAEMNVAGGEENLMPLHIAISNNCVETAKLLIKFGADLNATGKDQAGVEFTAMSLAEKMAKEYGCGDLLAAVKETKREVFEPVKPPTILCGPPPKLGKPIVFSVSGLTDEEKDLVAKFAEKFHERVTLSQNYNNDCNVLICGKSKTKTNSYPPSIKILAAILTNGLVVDVAWMRESINNRTFLNYETYMMDSICGLKGGIARARESSKTTSKKLFYGLKFYVSQKLQTFKFHEICLLIEIGDGQILAEAPDPSVGKKLLDDSKIKIEFMKEDSMICDMRLVYVTEDIFGHIEKLKDGAYKVSPDWVVNCVASYSLPSNVFPHCSSTDSANKPLQW